MRDRPSDRPIDAAHDIDPTTGLPVGRRVEPGPERWTAWDVAEGRWCRLERLAPRHAAELFAASTPADASARFTYLSTAPPASRGELDAWVRDAIASPDRRYYAVVDRATGTVGGRQAYLRIDAPNRSIEIGDVYWGPGISRTRVATEALHLSARHAFEVLGCRRFEWKCNALNEPSMRAAVRFGFTYEGTFRNAMITKGRSRDTAWFSMTDDEWPRIDAAFGAWLDPTNFDGDGVQRMPLAAQGRPGQDTSTL